MDNTLPPLKRIAAIHDLSGLGKCSLTVALPVISATGVECACIPTAVLSTHTGEFTGWTFRDLSDDMLPIAHHWQRIGARIDGVYSGYLASPEQAQLLAQTLDCIAAPDTLVVIDPVMADNGSYYSQIDDRMCAAFRRLLSRADVITPNVTEAALLAGLPYEPGTHSDAYLAQLFQALGALGAGVVTVTGRAPAAGRDRQRRLRLPHGGDAREHAPGASRRVLRHGRCVRLRPRGAARARRTAECRARNGHRAHGREHLPFALARYAAPLRRGL